MRDFDAVASALEVLPVGEDDLQGPSTKVGGAEFETIQVLLPLFGSVEHSMEQDLCRAAYSQVKPRERLMQLKIDDQTKMYVKPDKRDLKNRALSKALRGRQIAAHLQKWIAAQRKLVQEDGVSREELLEQLVPLAGAKVVHDPGAKASGDFMKLHKKLQVTFPDQH
jgi:hypothetical protein